MFEQFEKHDVAVYAGYLNSTSELLECTSGGIATALSEYMIDQGGYVAGVVYTDDFYSAEYILTKEKSDLKRLKGSKYIDCHKRSIYANVKSLVDSGEKVLFLGLPCIVAALYKYLGARPENLVTCELICHGPTTTQVHEEYIRHLEGNQQSKVVDFSVRRKKDTWTPGYLYAKFENGQIFEKPFYETEYGFAFSVFGKEPCYCCKFKGNNRHGDIMIGDFWGATDKDEFWNDCGVSSIFAETDKGNDFLTAIPGITLFPTTFQKAVEHNPMVIKSRVRRKEREVFSRLLTERGLIYAAKHSVSFKTTVKKVVPHRIVSILKKVYSCIKRK